MKKKNRLLRFAFVLAFLVSLGLGNELWAATHDISSAVNSSTLTWANGDVVNVQAGGALTFDASPSVNIASITIAETGSIVIETASTTVTVTGGVTNGGTIDMSAATASRVLTIGGALDNTGGTINLTGATAGQVTINVNGAVTAWGTLTAPQLADWVFGGSTGITLPATFACNNLTVSGGATVTLADNLTVGTITVTDGTLVTGTHNVTATTTTVAAGKTITVGVSGTKSFGTTTLNGTGVLDLSGVTSGSVSLSIAAISSALKTNAYTNLTTTAGLTLNATCVAFNNLTVSAGTLVLGGTTTVSGNLTATGDITVGANTLTVTGTLAGAGAITATDPASALVLNGPITYTGTIAGALTTTLSLGGTGNVTLPTINTGLESLTINRGGATVQLGANLNLATGAGALSLTSGTLDLNGKNLIIAAAGTITGESATNRIINTGASGAYVQATDAVASILTGGIGVTSLTTAAGLDAASGLGNVTVQRYPESLTIPGGTSSVKRLYNIAFTAGGPITTAKFAIDATNELNGNTATALNVFEASDRAFTTAEKVASTNSYNAGVMTGTGGISGTTGKFYGFATPVATTGTVTANSGSFSWNDPNAWTPVGFPSTTAEIVVSSGSTVTVPAGYAASAKSITVNGTGSLVLTGAAPTLTLTGDLIVNSTSTTAVTTSATTGAAAITIPGNLTNTSTGTINLTSGTNASDFVTVNVAGTITNTGGGTILTSGGAGTYGTKFNLTGTTNVSLPDDIATVHSLTVNKAGASVSLNGPLTVAGTNTLTLTSGTLVVGNNNLTVTGNTTISSGATLDASSTLAGVTRTFTGTTSIDGTGVLNASGLCTNTFTGAITMAGTIAGSTLNVANSTTVINGGISNGGANALAWTLNANGAAITFATVAADFAEGTFQTDQHTNLTINIAPTHFPAITELNDLTVGAALALAGNLTLTGNLTIADLAAATSLDLGGFALTVNGTYTNNGSATTNSVVAVGAGTFTLNGPIADWGTDHTSLTITAATGSLVIGGSGAITFPFAIGDVKNFGNVTMNRPNVNFEITGGSNATLNSLILTNGTVTLPTGAFAHSVTTTTNIGANGKLVTNGATSTTFTGVVSGTGTIDADHADDALVFSEVPTFTGTLLTSGGATGTILTYSKGGSLPASVSNLEELILTTGTITFNSDVTINDLVGATHLVANTSVFDVNGNTLTLTNGIAAGAIGGITLTNNSTLVSTAAADFAGIAARLLTDETSNLTFGGAAGNFPTTVTEVNNLTLTGAGALTTTANLVINGNLSVNSTGAFTVDDPFTLTVNGDVSAATDGSLVLTASTGAVTLNGQLTGTGIAGTSSIVTDASTVLVIGGSSAQFVMPSQVLVLGTLTLNRANGMRLNADLTVGIAATQSLTLTSGDLDLNGYVLTLDQATTYMSEAAGATVINTGATGINNGYITTAALASDAQAIASGIGIVAIAPNAAYTVRRYPTTIPISGVGLSASRVYRIEVNAPTSVTLQYDNTEVYSNAAGMRLYTAASATGLAFTTFEDRTLADGSNRAVNQNTPAGKGNVAYSPFKTMLQGAVANVAAGDYYALAAAPGTGGVLYTAAGSGEWGNAATWSPNGAPTVNDQVYIGPYTVTLRGNGTDFYCQSLVLDHNSSKLVAYDNNTNGDIVNLNVMGNITLQNSSSIDAINNYGRINITIGDGVTAGVSSTISAPAFYVEDNGLSVNNLTVKGASVSASTSGIRIYGDLTMVGNSAMQSAGDLEFFGGYNTTQTITIPSSASLESANIIATNSANVTTASSFISKGYIQVNPASQYIATNGTVTFPVTTNQGGWVVEEGATLRLYDVEIAGTGNNFTPKGNVEIAGNFTKSGASTFATTNVNTVTFKNTNQKELVNAGTAATMQFYNLAVAPNASVKTSSSFQIAGDIDVQQNATFVADNGTIDMIVGPATPSNIKNVSDHTLEFFNLTTTDDVLTSDNWRIAGDLLIPATGSLKANNGTVTFDNVSEKTITNQGGAETDLTFYGMKVTDASKVKTSAVAGEGEFTIKNNVTNPTGAGLFVEGTGQFIVTNVVDNLFFDASAGITAGNPKTISKSADGTIKLGLVTINAVPNNEVTTATDFEIQGNAAAFNNTGAGARFTATAGTVKFTGATPTIISVSPAVTTFYSILTEGATDLKLTSNQEIFINGNVTVNGTSQINPAAFAVAYGKFNFTGTEDQTIGGTSSIPNAVEFGKMIINKPNDSQVILATDVEITSDAANKTTQLVLTNGILNLGSKKLTVGADVISRLNGAINGATGTYLVNTDHQAILLEDAYFTVNDVPTLYNLTLNANHQTANDLTVNGTLNMNAGNMTIANGTSLAAAKKLILNGGLTRTSGVIENANNTPNLSVLVLQGSGTVSGGLSNSYFNTAANKKVSINVSRQETLGGDLTMDTDANLTINTGVSYFDLSTRRLTLNAGGGVTRVSGSITAGVNSTVDFVGITNVPANLFTNDEVGNFISTAAQIYLDGNLKINTNLNMTATADIITKTNTLTFGPNLTFTNPMTSANHVKGNLIRTVNASGLVEFPLGIGTGTEFMPVSMRLATSGNTQLVKVSVVDVDPTIGRGGNAKNAVNLTYNITPIGTIGNDSVLVKFQYSSPATYEQVTPVVNGAFPAKWNGLGWTDYRSRLANFAVATPRVITMTGFPVAMSDLSGVWGIFTVNANTTPAKDAAISMTANRVVVTKIDPETVKNGQAFKATVQLQDMNGQPITVATPFNIRIEKEYGTATIATVDAIIPAGSSMTTVTGLTATGTTGANHQLRADTVGGSANWQPTLSPVFAVVDVAPAVQSSGITFSNITPTSMTLTWTIGTAGNQIVLAKAESLLDADEFPVNTVTYVANKNFGSGSSLGDATVLYKGNTNTIDVTGLSPNTNYYFYVLVYSGEEGYENYKTSAATKNPNAQMTTGSTDDDVAFGTNNTRTTSKTIGTNTPVTGTIGTSTDEDWFNFSVTSASPNVRTQLYGLANNYNIEVYDINGRRIRRGIRAANGTEAPVVNDLPAGTYTVRIYSADGSYSSTNTYTLKVGTKSSEIFSVTP